MEFIWTRMEDGLIQLLVSTNRELPYGYRLPPSVQNPQLPNPQFEIFLRQQDKDYDGGDNGYDSSHRDAMVYNNDNINSNNTMMMMMTRMTTTMTTKTTGMIMMTTLWF